MDNLYVNWPKNCHLSLIESWNTKITETQKKPKPEVEFAGSQLPRPRSNTVRKHGHRDRDEPDSNTGLLSVSRRGPRRGGLTRRTGTGTAVEQLRQCLHSYGT